MKIRNFKIYSERSCFRFFRCLGTRCFLVFDLFKNRKLDRLSIYGLNVKLALPSICCSFLLMSTAHAITETCDVSIDTPCYSQVKAEILKLAKEKNIPPVIIQAIAQKESGWEHFYVNPNLPSCISNVDLQNIKFRCEPDGRIGIGLMQVTVPPDNQNFNKLALNWQYNLYSGVEKLWNKWEEQRRKAPNDTGLDIDPLVIENWYYPVMWYNGEGDRAWKYVQDAFSLMSNPPQKLEDIWNKVDGIKNPNGVVDMLNKKPYYLKDLALNSVAIHQWESETDTYSDITNQVLNGAIPTNTPVVIKDKGNWIPKTDGFRMPIFSSEGWYQSQAYANKLQATISGHYYNGLHPGEDWTATGVVGKSVSSIANGIVKDIKNSGGLGYGVIIQHERPDVEGAMYSVYYHVNPSISKGQYVYRGQEIAKVGNFTDVPPHLHFELRNKLPADIYKNDMGDGYYIDTDKMRLDGFFTAPSSFIGDNNIGQFTNDVTPLMKTYRDNGFINSELNQYFIEKRGLFVMVLIRAIEDKMNTKLAEASDLPYADVSTDNTARTALLKACKLKILTACNGLNTQQTTFRPNDPITRQEALSFTVRTYEALSDKSIILDETLANTFVDVPKTNSFNKVAEKGYKANLANGIVDGSNRYFYPSRWVQRGETVSFVNKLMLAMAPDNYVGKKVLLIIREPSASGLSAYKTYFNEEANHIKSYLQEMGITTSIKWAGSVSIKAIKDYDLVLYDDMGWCEDSATLHYSQLTPAFIAYHQLKKPLYFIGDDLAFNCGYKTSDWFNLIGLTPSGNGWLDDVSPLADLNTLLPSNYGVVNGFSYLADIDDTTAQSYATPLLKTASGYDAVITYKDSYGKVITQLPDVYASASVIADTTGLASLKSLFQKSVAYLLKP